ncbi:hypothetical protein [Paracoccus sp. (in: a-proteobacteria)]|uniref:hypothetical protein n=1 Tax=Paracoccus sp. TaxID=267 RepID=UPI003A86E55B
MANQSALRKVDTPEPVRRAPRDAHTMTTDELVQRLLKASNSNEVAEVIGLLPIKGLSGPNLFY